MLTRDRLAPRPNAMEYFPQKSSLEKARYSFRDGSFGTQSIAVSLFAEATVTLLLSVILSHSFSKRHYLAALSLCSSSPTNLL